MHTQVLIPKNVGSVLNIDHHLGLFSYTCIYISSIGTVLVLQYKMERWGGVELEPPF